MKRFFKLFLLSVVLTFVCTSCEKGCICRNLDTGAADELYGVYSKNECESYTEYYKILYKLDNVDCSYEIRK